MNPLAAYDQSKAISDRFKQSGSQAPHPHQQTSPPVESAPPELTSNPPEPIKGQEEEQIPPKESVQPPSEPGSGSTDPEELDSEFLSLMEIGQVYYLEDGYVAYRDQEGEVHVI